MTGFSTWLDAQPRVPSVNNSLDALAIVGRYRKSLTKRFPAYGAELAGYRKKRQRPAGRIIVTDDANVAEGLIDVSNSDYPLLINGYRHYDFSLVFGLPVLYLMPNQFWALDVAHQIAEASPSSFSLIWPHCEQEEVLWN